MSSGKPVGGLSMNLECADGQILYEIIYSKRKTLAVQVTRTGQVQVKAPSGLSVSMVNEFVQKHRGWIFKHLEEVKHQLANRIVMTEDKILEYQNQARRIFSEKAAYWAETMGVDYGTITVRSQTSRWGSCSSRGNLSFNWRVILMPQEIQDYVVVHELAHRIEMNHSERFWKQVERYLPEYKNYRKWLRCHGGEYEVFSEH